MQRRDIEVMGVCAGALMALAGSALGQVVDAEVVLREGQAAADGVVDRVGAPVTNGNNEVGFLAVLDNGTSGIWVEGGFIFRSDLVSADLAGGESSIGLGDSGQFIYSPSLAGDDSVWGEGGLILVENTQAPDFPANINTTFHSRPRMAGNGAAYWVSGFNDGFGGTSTQGRMIYRQAPGGGEIETVVRAGDTIDGRTVEPFGGIDFDFAVSRNDANLAFVFNDQFSDNSLDGTLVLNGGVVATEGSATGQGDNWDNFDRLSVNDLGNLVFSGDTDGDSGTDEFIAYNGEIKLRQGDSVGERTLGTAVDSLTLNNLNQLAFIWNTDLEETLFFAADASNPQDAIELLSVGDLIDTDNDGLADFTIDDFNAFNSEDIGFGTDGYVSVEVDLVDDDGVDAGEAIIRVRIPSPGASLVLAMGGVAFGTRRRGS